MRFCKVLMVFLGLNLVAACTTSDPIDRIDHIPVSQLYEVVGDADALRRYIAGNTLWSYSDPRDGHGTQVEFHSNDGKVFLWYPGNIRPVLGEWKIEVPVLRPQLCYRYQRNSYNPVTGTRGGEWECTMQTWYFLPKSIIGDPFGLGTSKIPFPIPDQRYYSPRRLMVMAGKDPALITMFGFAEAGSE